MGLLLLRKSLGENDSQRKFSAFVETYRWTLQNLMTDTAAQSKPFFLIVPGSQEPLSLQFLGLDVNTKILFCDGSTEFLNQGEQIFGSIHRSRSELYLSTRQLFRVWFYDRLGQLAVLNFKKLQEHNSPLDPIKCRLFDEKCAYFSRPNV